MIETLKELKKIYPNITTQGSIYYIDGLGYYRQVKTAFGIITYTRNENDEWKSVNFKELVDYLKQIN